MYLKIALTEKIKNWKNVLMFGFTNAFLRGRLQPIPLYRPLKVEKVF